MLATYRSTAQADAAEPTMARVAGYSLEQVDSIVGKLGEPIGIKCYKPYQSVGEDFLHNYLGNIGIPIDLYPTFPTDAKLVLLTESSKYDPEIVAKIKGQLTAGKNVVITSGLVSALAGKGIEDIVEVRATDRKINAQKFVAGFGAGSGVPLADEDSSAILIPEVRFLTNDAWPVVRALAEGGGYALLLMDRYSKGVLYIWTIPDNFNDLYRLPTPVTSAVKDYVMAGFPVRVDGPAHMALFAYDNDTFVVESYRSTTSDVSVGLLGGFTKLRNLLTDEVIEGKPAEPNIGRGRRANIEPRTTFALHLLPHSYVAFAAEK
jgi:hypothetical protein